MDFSVPMSSAVNVGAVGTTLVEATVRVSPGVVTEVAMSGMDGSERGRDVEVVTAPS